MFVDLIFYNLLQANKMAQDVSSIDKFQCLESFPPFFLSIYLKIHLD